MQPTKPQAIELPCKWVLSQYIPRNRLRLVIARCNSRVEAVRLMNAIATTDAALVPCLSVHHEDDLHLVTGNTSVSLIA